MKAVEFHELTDEDGEPEKKRVGRILWDGQTLRAEPDDHPFLKEILREPLPVMRGQALERLRPEQDPEGWLNALADYYRGTYFWASRPREVEGGVA